MPSHTLEETPGDSGRRGARCPVTLRAGQVYQLQMTCLFSCDWAAPLGTRRCSPGKAAAMTERRRSRFVLQRQAETMARSARHVTIL